MLTLRLIDPDDGLVLEDGQPIGRVPYASDRSPGPRFWTVTLPVPPFGDAASIEEAKGTV
ncbi:hypothetical protein [Bradyrhizobium nanningense]|uniref:hypothetical protein n=1 Tax=Bradyrhizobium nanningense TaxID=1325118 RepID=UPI001FDEFE38|nr:hypothetical protein [Bradyrhizobium nanningense]